MDRSRRHSTISTKSPEKSLSTFLSLKYILGCRSQGNFNEFLFDISAADSITKRILYCAGNVVIIFKLETKSQTFITPLEESLSVSSIAISKDRSLIAIAEETEITGLISIYEFKNDLVKKRKTLVSKDSQACKYSNLLFSSDAESRLLFSLTEPQSLKVFVWEWQKGKLRAMIDVAGFSQVNGMFVPENDHSLIFMYGQPSSGLPVKCLWLRRDNEQLLLSTKNDIIKDFLKNYSKNFLSHCSLSDNSMLFGTERGELIVFSRQFEIKQVIGCSPLNNIRLNALKKTARGFAACGSNFQLLFFERKDGDLKGPWECSPHSLCGHSHHFENILDMLLLDSETAVIALDSGEVMTVSVDASGSAKIDPLIGPFHSGQMIDFDVCERKPYLATCATDNCVKVWNYQEFVLEYEKIFDSEILGLSFHATGLYIAVALKSVIKVLMVQNSGLSPFFEIQVNEARLIRFSNSGHLLAVACENSINLFEFFGGEFKNNVFLKADESVTINCLRWAEDDLRIFAGCLEGPVFEIEVRESMKYNLLFKNLETSLGLSVWNEHRTKGPSSLFASTLLDKTVRIESLFSTEGEPAEVKEKSVDVSANGRTAMGDSFKKHMGVASNSSSQTPSFLSKPDLLPRTVILQGKDPLSAVAISSSGKYLILATDGIRGLVRVFALPSLQLICETNLSSKGVKKMSLSADDSTLFVLSKDNCVFFLDLRDRELKERKEKEGESFVFDEYFVDEKILKRQIEEIEQLQVKVIESEKLAELNMKRTRLKKEEYVKNFETRMKGLAENRIREIEQIEKDIEELTVEMTTELETLAKRHAEKRQTLQTQHSQKMEREAQRQATVLQNYELLVTENSDALQEIKQEHKAQAKMISESYEEKIKEIDQQIECVEKQTKEAIDGFKRASETVEGHLDGKVSDKKATHEQELERLIRAKNKREYELGLAKVEFNNMIQQKNQAEKENKDNSEQIKTLESKIKELKKEKDANDREMEEREKTIVQKQQRINELVNKKHELDKFKFVLHFKIEELKKEKGPRELEIIKMKQQLQAMQQEIYLFAKNNVQLKLSVSKCNLKLQGQTKSLKEIEQSITEKTNLLASFKQDLSKLIYSRLENFKEAKKGLVGLYNSYVEEDKNSQNINEKKKTFTEQRGHVENNLKTLKEKFGRSVSLHKNDHKRVMKENVDLISAINELKRERKLKMDNISKVDALKQDAQREIELALRINRNAEIILELNKSIETLTGTPLIEK